MIKYVTSPISPDNGAGERREISLFTSLYLVTANIMSETALFGSSGTDEPGMSRCQLEGAEAHGYVTDSS